MALNKREMAKIDKQIQKIQDKLAFSIWDIMADMEFNSNFSKTEIKRITLRDCKIYIKDYPNWK